MVRNYKRKLGKAPNCNYTEENLSLAIREARLGKISLRKISEKYSIPRTTIKRKMEETHPKKYGRQPALNNDEERQIAQCLIVCGEWGFPLTKLDIRLIIKQFLDRIGRQESRFRNNMPGKDFINLFLKRHPELSVRFSENIKRCRAAVGANLINSYFDQLANSLEGVSAESIVNYDETNFCDDPGKQKVIIRRGSKHPKYVIDSSKSSTSLMMSGSASGVLLPPYIVYRAENLYPTWIEGGPAQTRYNRSKNGWFEERTFEDWFLSIALPYLKKQPAPRVLIGDNLSSHISQNVIQTCNENDIRFVLLPPNSTGICQPMDVAFFAPLKRKWRAVLLEWKQKNRGVVPKSDFPKLLKKTLEALETASENLKAGFAACGICPLNRQKVLQRLPKEAPDEHIISNAINQEFIEFLKKTRMPENQQKKPRGKKIKVAPGKSVSFEHNETSSDEGDYSEHNESSDDEIFETEVSNDEEILETEELQEVVLEAQEKSLDELVENDFVIVKFEITKGKRNLHYVGQIINKIQDKYQINFLRKVVGKDIYFCFPQVRDECLVEVKDIVETISLKKHCRGRYLFNMERKTDISLLS